MIGRANQNQAIMPADMIKRIKWRSKVILALRFIVPAIGVLLLLVLLAPTLLELVLPKGSFDRVRVSDSRLIVDAPRARGTMADGGNYVFTAKEAASELSNQDKVFLIEMLGVFTFADETVTRATSDEGEYLFSTEVLTLKTLIDIISSKGDEGQIGSGVADTKAQKFYGNDGVKFRFADGTQLDADTMFYDAGRQYWRFTNATLVMDEETQ